MIKSISITIIIDEIKSKQKISLINKTILKILPKETILTSIEKYTKFPNAHKLEYSVAFIGKKSKEKQVYQMLLLSDSIARPWLVYFDNYGFTTALIFNRDKNTQTTAAAFSPIRWAHIQLIY